MHKIIREAYAKGYRVLEDGSVISPFSGERVGVQKDRYGYPRFSVRVEGKRAKLQVYRLAAYQKYGEAVLQKGLQVRHLDGDESNSRLDNIGYGSPSDNQMDKPPAVRLRVSRQAAMRRRKLTDTEVKALRDDRDSGLTYPQLMEKYGVAKSTVSYIVNRKTYSY